MIHFIDVESKKSSAAEPSIVLTFRPSDERTSLKLSEEAFKKLKMPKAVRIGSDGKNNQRLYITEVAEGGRTVSKKGTKYVALLELPKGVKVEGEYPLKYSKEEDSWYFEIGSTPVKPKEQEPKTEHILVFMRPLTLAKIDRLARSQGMNRSDYCNNIIENYLEGKE